MNLINQKDNDHAVSYKLLAVILLILLFLTATTVLVSRINLGHFKIWTALLIAAIKTTFVLLFFMRIKEAGSAVMTAFITTVIILAIFIGFTFFDISFR